MAGEHRDVVEPTFFRGVAYALALTLALALFIWTLFGVFA